MSQNQKTRSKLLIGAVVKAAAAATSPTALPPGKVAAIAGLAGFVLRLFRSRDTRSGVPCLPESGPSLPRRGRGRPARIRQGSEKGSARMREGSGKDSARMREGRPKEGDGVGGNAPSAGRVLHQSQRKGRGEPWLN